MYTIVRSTIIYFIKLDTLKLLIMVHVEDVMQLYMYMQLLA